MANGQWLMVNGQWSMVNGQWSVVSGQWSVVNICQTTNVISELLPKLSGVIL